MKIVAFIPARYDSTRFPGKPLALIAGKPMIRHVYRRAVSSPEISEVYVASDDERICRCVLDFGGKAVMTRKDHASGTDRIAEAAEGLRLDADDLIVNIQGDQPAFRPSAITDLLSPFAGDPTTVMSTLRYRIRDEQEAGDPNHVKVVTDREGFALFFSRSPIPFFRDRHSRKSFFKHLGFYAYRMEFLRKFAGLPPGELETAEKLEQLRALEHGYRIRVVETSSDSIEVDTPRDIEKVERILSEPAGDGS